MYNEFEDEIWESFLKAAVIENSLNEIKDYPSEQEINGISLPVHYDLRMRKVIKRYRFRKNIKISLRYGRKIASIILLILGISFTAMLFSEDVRAACRNVIVNIYEKYIQFDYVSSNSETVEDLECTYLPDGYYLFESKKDEYGLQLKYKNGSEDTIELFVYFYNSTTHIDNEHYKVSDIQIKENPGKFFESTDAYFMNQITWHTEQGAFRLSSSLEKDIMIKIAENIK
ncbi:DUF4367 domain-containing protein [Clostridium sp. AM25-23AC]|jgi:hypothetical protein|uniref:DUF4367 domain-containing protein n=1 Tax=Clostridium sp. AM25-23AC TaxID=2305240 RepID=UPI000E405B4E|nr:MULTISPECIES: DUF4367 domain-containing protein [unclassified Clostridium]RGD92213.1 DUF4367 domain-containing protein [Clostridium sp. AM25-23AC]RHO00628.1 DUF4367 domain-containing protein [Clostridium sp. AM22-16AC]RHO38726.1 DUF4367 domain-containing protein [Clostridium sp. AM16-23]